MGQFKPMVKMETTEPSVELKLKKGGSVSSAKKMAMGGNMGALSQAMTPGARGGMAPSMSPAKPSMAARKAAMAGGRKRLPMPSMAPYPAMKKGGKAEMETPSMHKAEMSEISKVGKELKSHAGKPASKAHKGLKTGGVMKSPKPGNYATGGVVNGQGGFAKGGAIAKSGIIMSKTGGTKMSTAKVNTNSAPTGEVKMGNAGGYKAGGAPKKHYATGGAVNDSGRAVAMPKKPASKAVSNDRQSGTFKKGGTVKMSAGGASQEQIDKAYNASIGPSSEDLDMAKTIRDIPSKLFRGAKKLIGMDKPPKAGSVTKTEKSVTVEPAKKRGGSVKC